MSVIIPVYNVENYIRQSLDSMLSQTFTDWEAILVDDGSTDSSGAVCDEYAQHDTRFIVIHQSNNGLSGARNAGINVAKGTLIGFLDPDDWVEPMMYETLIEMFNDDKIDVAICRVFKEYIDRHTVFPHAKLEKQIITRQEAIAHILRNKELKSYVCNKVYRRHVISVPFPDGLLFEDYIVMPQWFNNVNNIAYTSEPLYHYRQRGSGIVNSHSLDKMIGLLYAELFRANIVPKLEGVEIDADIMAERVVKSALKVAKHIVRDLPPSGERAHALDTIVNLSKPYYMQITQKLPLTKRLLFRYLMDNTSVFEMVTRLGYRLLPSRLLSKHKLYK